MYLGLIRSRRKKSQNALFFTFCDVREKFVKLRHEPCRSKKREIAQKQQTFAYSCQNNEMNQSVMRRERIQAWTISV